MRGLNEATASHGIEELLQKFGDLKENFDRGVGVEVLKQVLSTGKPLDSTRLPRTRVIWISHQHNAI